MSAASWDSGVWTDGNGVTWVWDAALNRWVVQNAAPAAGAAVAAVGGGAPSAGAVAPQVMAMPDEQAEQPDYFEVMRREREQKKLEEQMLAKGELPPAMAAAERRIRRKQQRQAKKRNRAPNAIRVRGWPADATFEEIAAFLTRFGGVIKKDTYTRQPKLYMQQDADGNFNGEVICVFFRPEAVQQAQLLVDGAKFREQHELSMEVLQRDRNKGKRKKIDRRLKRYNQEKEELAWEEEKEKVHVIIKHVFTLQEAQEDAFQFYEDLREELLSELNKLGKVKTLKIFERNPEGVVAVKYDNAKGAIRCIDRMNGRFFAGRKLEAFYYDGFADYEVPETDEERERRIKAFGEWLGSKNKGDAQQQEGAEPAKSGSEAAEK